MTNIFAGVKDAKASMDTTYVGPGHYLLRVDRIKMDISRKNVPFVAVNFTVLKTFSDGEGYEGGLCHREGMEVCHFHNTQHDGWLGRFKGFLCTIMQEADAAIEEDSCTAVCDPATQPLQGLVVEAVARTVQTKAGNDVTSVSYKRPVRTDELLEVLDESIIVSQFPGNAMTLLEQKQNSIYGEV